MSEVLEKELKRLLVINPKLKFLEVGCGSGINLETVKKVGVYIENIVGIDINDKAVTHCRQLGFRTIKSNLFSKVKGKFDVIVFNPPYLPRDSEEPKSSRRETTGGLKGNEIIIKFFKQAKGRLTEEGKILIITSSLSENINFKDYGYEYKIVGEKRLFFEKLTCWELIEK